MKEPAPRPLYTVAQFSARYPAWTIPSLRNLIALSQPRPYAKTARPNGLAEAGAIVRVGRRVLIDEAAFFAWIAAQQSSRKAA